MIRQAAKQVVCGISGGVDSAVAALLLKKKGFHVTGAFMRNWDTKDEFGECRADKDLEDAKLVCSHLHIPLHEVNFVKEYWNEVFTPFLENYQKAWTPNPDILCNKYIKFDAFFDHAINNLGADYVATGHYARSSYGEYMENYNKESGAKLLRALDDWKDQTFFLSQINQRALQKTIFPLGDIPKEFVKQIAHSAGLSKIAEKKESMGICFIGKRKFKNFIAEYIPPKPGQFVDVDTKQVLAEHKGIHNYTLGQRISCPGLKFPYYVVEKDAKTQEILVAAGTNHPALFTTTVFTDCAHWIHSPPRLLLQDQMLDCQMRFQHVHPLTDCTLTLCGNNCLIINIAQPMRAITPGQYAVFYLGDECLGSAQIMQTGATLYTLGHREQVNNLPGFT
ncbi:mitochondrial tRNA-specific 2-thiouridylase 1-like [Lineus longissimus]|uniref:mitochondrial tRNA-specific 2-thiouridylase 1-like n=1 Tax=Lineus longissimus TaxID=88925 RepID=UPI002B4D8310